ncbi:hypothetical protein OG780_42555 [Streptomyces sp. NBC_00386]|uniref:hypothetical protein n=1 Tax=Streptomyces sp. NBC_00386 TaxID=2975734 RepID=UPI002E1F8193
MNAFLSALGSKLAERWVSLLVLPGALFAAIAAAAFELGHRHALDERRLSHAAEDLAARYNHRPVSAVLLAAAAAAAAAAIGLLARGLGSAVEKAWVMTGPAWLTSPLVRWRLKRWEHAQRAAVSAPAPERAGRVALRNAIALTEPTRATWIGDRLRSVGVRIQGQYGLDFSFTWPRLWLILPDNCRGDVIAAREAMTGASTQCGWALLYLCLGVVWWPAALAGAALLLLGWRHGRETVSNLADLTESAVDLYAAELARTLGAQPPTGVVSPGVGRQLSERFRKGA